MARAYVPPQTQVLLSKLKYYDTVFIVDDSWSSMLLDLSLTRVQLSIANFKQVDSLWAETRSAFAGVVRTCVPYDRDGIDLHFFNAYGAENLTTTEEVMKLFNGVKPEKGKLTPTATALERVLLPYIRRLELAHSNRMPNLGGQAIKPLNVIILTDGVPFPLPKENPEALIVDIARRLDTIGAPSDQIGLSFVQIGNDKRAARALTYLDTKLKKRYRIRDMVDTVAAPLKGVPTTPFLVKALLGGIDTDIDNQTIKKLKKDQEKQRNVVVHRCQPRRRRAHAHASASRRLLPQVV